MFQTNILFCNSKRVIDSKETVVELYIFIKKIVNRLFTSVGVLFLKEQFLFRGVLYLLYILVNTTFIYFTILGDIGRGWGIVQSVMGILKYY